MANQANAPVRATAIVNAFLAGTQSIDAANASLVAAKLTLLDGIKSALKGVPAVDDDDWAKGWAQPVYDALKASGRYTVDDKGVSLSARVAASTLKVAVIALTNEYEPEDKDTSLKSFVSRVRPELAKEGLIEAPTAGAKKKDGERKSTAKEDARNAALALVCGRDKHRAKLLGVILMDYLEELDDWMSEIIVERDNQRRGKRRAA
jgi:hypothetical protein